MMAEEAAQVRDIQLSTVALIKLVKLDLAAGEAAGSPHYERAGARLLELKRRVEQEKKKWTPWVKKHLDLSTETARRYMKAAESAARLKDTHPAGGSVPRTLSEAAGDHRPHHQAQWYNAAREAARESRAKATAHYTSQRETRIAEGRLLRERAHQLIDAGYRILAAKYHPDKEGGSHAEMTCTTRARDKLRAAAKFF